MYRSHPVTVLLSVACAALLLAGCATATPPDVAAVHGDAAGASLPPVAETVAGTPVLDLTAMPDLAGIIPRLADKRVVYVGERHDEYAHHLAQLEIIRRLHERDPQLAIGMEAFQQPFQSVLDDYVAGKLDEQTMLRNSEYYQRWRMDYRLYAPILHYAREHLIPVIALNLPTELTSKVAHAGIDALSADERAQLPADIDRSDQAYEQRLREIYAHHPHQQSGFGHFLDVQLLWDEGMAQRAADWLAAHPDMNMVVLTGSGHLIWGSGIPQRLARRLPVKSAIVLNGWNGDPEPGMADFILMPEPRTLPAAGQFGVFLKDGSEQPTVESCMPDSPCTRAGLQRGDRFVSIDGQPVNDLTDLRLAMWNRRPGDKVTLMVSRKGWFSDARELGYSIELR